MVHDKNHKSRLLSFVLRHDPGSIGIELDDGGWTPVAGLVEALARAGKPMPLEELESIVATSEKQRFAFSPDRRLIRANQGHSVPVDLGLTPTPPPSVLYHGTARQFVASIARGGLKRGKRHHVHLHADRDVADSVGRRRGEAVVLSVEAAAMHRDGIAFYVSANGVWMTEAVPPEYLRGPDGKRLTAGREAH